MSGREIRGMYPEDFAEYQSLHREKSYMLVDVRQPEEYIQEHIPGALNLPLPELEQHLSRLQPDRDLIFYCASGRRSQVAAGTAAEELEPTGAIYNLTGGISAWSGTVLPDYPRVEAFDPQSTAPELLRRAMDLEKGAYRFYDHVSRIWPEADLSGLRDAEITHARNVHTLLKRRYGAEESFEDLFHSLPGESLEGGASLQETLDRLRFHERGGCLALAELALEIESSAYDLYRHVADIVDDRELERDLLVLAEQEKGHIKRVIRNIPECVRIDRESGTSG
jgi:rhodanese-related sulfurtransferase/rubrerythrin